MKKLISLTLIAIIVFTLILSVGSDSQPSVQFESIEELWAYEFDAYESSLSSNEFDVITQKKITIVPVLPEEYGRYIIDAVGGMLYYSYRNISEEKIKGFNEPYKNEEDYYVSIAILHSTNNLWQDSNLTLEEIIENRRESHELSTNPNKGEFVFGYAENNGIQFAYISRNGVGITNIPFSYTNIYTFFKDKYYVYISLPFSNEEMALEFIEEIEFETLTVSCNCGVCEICTSIEVITILPGVTAVIRNVTSLFLKVGTIVSDFDTSELTIEVKEILPGGVTDDVDVLFGEIVDFFKSK